MINTYLIREGAGETTEIDLPTAAHMIDRGKLKFTGKKSKWNAVHAEMQTRRFYVRVDRPARSARTCDRPCCSYLAA